MANEDKVDSIDNDKTKMLSISSTFKKSTGRGYLISSAKKVFNYL